MAKTNFSMQITETQKDIMDFATEVIFDQYEFSKAEMVFYLVKKSALDYVGIPIDELFSISDEILYSMMREKKFDEDMKIITFCGGVDKFRATIERHKKEYPGVDCSHFEELLAEYIKREGK